jgi:hypothetical protein
MWSRVLIWLFMASVLRERLFSLTALQNVKLVSHLEDFGPPRMDLCVVDPSPIPFPQSLVLTALDPGKWAPTLSLGSPGFLALHSSI